jgi:hypothetical protein
MLCVRLKTKDLLRFVDVLWSINFVGAFEEFKKNGKNRFPLSPVDAFLNAEEELEIIILM